VVGHAAPLGHIGLGDADVEAPVEIAGIGVDHLPVEPGRQLDAEAGLAGGGRPGDHHEW
jgi:hypothetical protein